jgi:hypothetical protein
MRDRGLRLPGVVPMQNGDSTFCPIRDFNSLRGGMGAHSTTLERFGSRLTLADSTERSDSIALRGLGLARRDSFDLLVEIFGILRRCLAGRDLSNRA